ncbi:MAG: type II toxin-antitoxin system Phd/YefM family antitoxin [Burkholderiaceae bacterium]
MYVSMQEFKSHLAKYVGQAQAGETIELTSHRKVVARVIGVPHTEREDLTRLLATGAATWLGGKPQGASLVLSVSGKPVSTIVLDDRG